MACHFEELLKKLDFEAGTVLYMSTLMPYQVPLCSASVVRTTPELSRCTMLSRIRSTYSKLNLAAERMSIKPASAVGSNELLCAPYSYHLSNKSTFVQVLENH